MAVERPQVSEDYLDKEKTFQLYFKAGSLVTQYGEKHKDSIRVAGKIPEPQDIRGCSEFSISLSKDSGDISIRNELKDSDFSGVAGLSTLTRDGNVRTKIFSVEYVTRVRASNRLKTYPTYSNLVSALGSNEINYEDMSTFLEKVEKVLQKRKSEFERVEEKSPGIALKILSATERVIGHVSHVIKN